MVDCYIPCLLTTKGYSRKKYLGGEDGRRYIFLWVVVAESFQIIWVVGVRPNLITFCGFPWVETSTAGRVYDLCVYYMTGAPEGSPKVVLCGFMVLWRSRESNLRPLVYKA